MLYDRDYNVLTTEEHARNQEAEDYCKRNSGIRILNAKYYELKPSAAYHYESLFPNNYLNKDSLEDKAALKNIGDDFEKLLESDITERNILNFINKYKYYNLIASIFQEGYRFGHHDAYLFKEFELTSTYKADYLLCGKNSDGYHFIFVELENPSGSITTKDGSFGQTIMKGLKQVRDWNKWIEGNFHTLNLVFDKYTNQNINPRIPLPDEFRTLDKTRINFVVIAGRRYDFEKNPKTYDERRRLYRNENIKLLHYDNLIDLFSQFQTVNNYW